MKLEKILYFCYINSYYQRIMSYLKERIKHAVRFRHKRGYGVHSPYMFNLILNVIRDKEKQFTYPVTLEHVDVLSHRTKKVFRLLSRLIRYLQVRKVVCLGESADLLVQYLSLAYPEAYMQSNEYGVLANADFVYIGRKAEDNLPKDFSFSRMLKGDRKYVVIADIYKDTFNGRIWRQYRDKATVSVDMMWYGVLLFDEKIQKGKYNLMI